MIQFRRLVSVLLGVWLGAGIALDLAVTQNFSTVDRFIQTPGNVATSVQLNQMGRANVREVLRRNAAEENNTIFDAWEWAELGIGALLFFLLLFGDRPQVSMMAMALLMLLIVALQHFAISPQILSLSRLVPDLPKEAKEGKTFWMFHGIYSGSELLKIGIGLAFAVRLTFRRHQDTDHFKKEYESGMKSSAAEKAR